MFGRKKKPLFDADPTTLSIEQLGFFKAALTAKLLIVGRELACRYESIVTLSEGLPDHESRDGLSRAAASIRTFNVLLEQELSCLPKTVPHD